MTIRKSNRWLEAPVSTKPVLNSPQARAWAEHRLPEAYPGRDHEAPGGTRVCTECLAVWHEKRWHLDEHALALIEAAETLETILCPSCQKASLGGYDGLVTLHSRLLSSERDEIKHLIAHVEQDLRADNPLVRIAAIRATGETMEIRTITPFLAVRIGKALQHAYDGRLTIKRPEGEGLVRVTWER